MPNLAKKRPVANKNSNASLGRHRSSDKGPHRVRIIGGQWKRSPIAVLDAPGLRPTPDRVRETLFNWLNHLFDGQWQSVHCLDLFAGTGALGLEAASRGAAQVTMVENSAAVVRQLEAVKAKLNAQQVKVVRGDALSILQNRHASARTTPEQFDLIFLDPPYHQGWLPKMLPLCARILKKDGLVYAESEQSLQGELAADWLQGWEIIRADKAGMVFYHLLKRNNLADFQA